MSNSNAHPKPVPGAAEYWASGKDVTMKDTDGHYHVIESKASPASAAKAAASWQNRENKAVEKERKRLEKIANNS